MVKSYDDTTRLNSIPKYNDGIAFNENGQLGLIASNLISRNWNGAIAIFDDAKFAPNIPHMDYGAVTESGCTDLAWINSTRIVVATDSGSLEIWNLKEQPCIEQSVLLSEHADICSSVSVSQQTKQIISGSWDNYIKIWDLEVDLSINTLLIHSEKISDIEWNEHCANVFASASEDGTVRIYDNREVEKPVFTLHTEKIHYPTAIAWLEENKLVCGNSNGDISLCDARKASETTLTVRAHEKSINEMVIASNSKIFTASEDTTVKMFDSNFVEVYCDKRHEDYVTSVAVNTKDNSIWSCGWDGKIFLHTDFHVNNKMES